MKVLIIGSGGREHALAWKISQSPLLDKLFIAPGNAGTAALGQNIPLPSGDFDQIKTFVIDQQIDMVVVGPEVPLVEGIHDFFLADELLRNIAVIGPVRKAAMLEGSKDFAKAFMQRHQIPTAGYRSFQEKELKEAIDYLKELKPPYVLKADGLAAGKGVLICQDFEEAESELRNMLSEKKFGSASSKVIIEEFLEGIELSVFVLTDGKSYVLLPEAKDYKRIGEGDTGLNTGGMGSISPVPFASPGFMQKIESRIIKPTILGLQKENIDYKGFIFFGLINVDGEPFVIEYNARMGDPEAESVIPRIKSDLLDVFIKLSKSELENYRMETDARATAAVMMVSGGYPGHYEKGKKISGLESSHKSMIFHAGSTFSDDGKEVVTSGGRVLAVCSYGRNIEEALALSYENVSRIRFEKSYYRKDLGKDLLGYLSKKD
jgi:phosphoribosylamine---glycine ligase